MQMTTAQYKLKFGTCLSLLKYIFMLDIISLVDKTISEFKRVIIINVPVLIYD